MYINLYVINSYSSTDNLCLSFYPKIRLFILFGKHWSMCSKNLSIIFFIFNILHRKRANVLFIKKFFLYFEFIRLPHRPRR
jgi:hypothetical protein